MSFTDRLILWLHVAFVIFAIGPVTIAALASPRYIRHRDVAVLRYLLRTTRIFGASSLGVLIFGIVAAQELHDLGKAWLTASITLFVVALVLLVLIMRDQRRAVTALETAAEKAALVATATAATAEPGGAEPGSGGTLAEDAPEGDLRGGQAPDGAQAAGPGGDGGRAAGASYAASVERGRIASLSGVVSLIWLVILVLMIWQP
jgi:FtsH-binding integral membrane protein